MPGSFNTRRAFLGSSIAGTLGLALAPIMQKLLAGQVTSRRARSCILLWLNGGPSHLDTFDPKPGTDLGGPFKAINTKVPGLQLNEHFPRLAEQAKHLAILRSLTSKEADHERAYEYLHTGNPREETVEYPALGSVVARAWKEEDGDLPAFVALNGGTASPGFLGVDFAAYLIEDLTSPINNIGLPEGVSEKRRDRRLNALSKLNGQFAQSVDRSSVQEHEQYTAKALRLARSPALQAFDLKTEKPEVLKRFGIPPEVGSEPAPEDQPFAKACLLARRLVEKGVRFVEITLDGWDTHSDNFNQTRRQASLLDPAFAALVADLADRGLLKETLVVCLGEFGRTPKLNEQLGRDHWSDVFSAVLAGGGVRGGQVIGASDAKGEKVKDQPIGIPDLYATLLAAFGIDGTRSYRTPEGRPIRLAEKGKVVKELFS